MHNTLPRFFTFIKTFNKDHIKNLNNDIAIIYRNYSNGYSKGSIEEIRNFCRKYGKKFYLSNNINLARSLNLDGVYIPSFNRSLNMNNINQNKKFLRIGSAHSIKEIKIKEKQGVKLLFLSSIFKNNKDKKFLGCVKFNNLANQTTLKIIALGGINKKNMSKLKITNAYGFASISLFETNYKLQKNFYEQQ